jgi:hypothetical protein
MNRELPHASANNQHESKPEPAFAGFQRPTANFLFCPNQFFDICLKSNSRGMVRIVAYVLRQTIGWLDKNGMPINQQVKVSYRDLIEKAGVSRGAIGPAIQRAVAMRFLECRVEGYSKSTGQSSRTAEYAIRWDEKGDYTKSFEHFNGFFTGEGNRTQIPNAFFDQIICTESLAVTKVVGTVLRHTVGYVNQFGGRRTEASLSYSQIHGYTNTSDSSTLAQAIRTAIDSGYIIKVEEGNFNARSDRRTSASYAIRWLETNKNVDNGSKTRPERQRFKNQTSIGSKSRPVERFKNQTSNKTTIKKDISKQQLVAAEFLPAVNKLIEAGFSSDTANEFVQKRGVAVVERQLKWIDARNPKNRLGMLRNAIKEDWDEPEAYRVKQKIAQSRTRDARKDELRSLQDFEAIQKKKARIERKNRLLMVWGNASLADRARWIESAAKAASGKVLRDIIRRQAPNMQKPHFQVLDELAREMSLPMIVSSDENAESILLNSN